MDVRQVVRTELARRRQCNPRYSLRAFARDLGTDHSSLSQIMRGRRGLSSPMIKRLGTRLGWNAAFIVEACARQDAEVVLRLAHTPAFRTHSRWIATRTGIPVDAVNIALHRLLHQGQLVMRSENHWHINPNTHA